MQEKNEIESSFEAQIERITVVTQKETQEEFAEFFDDSPASVASIFQRGKLPYRWLVILTQCKRVNPEWVLTGTGPAFFPSPRSGGPVRDGGRSGRTAGR